MSPYSLTPKLELESTGLSWIEETEVLSETARAFLVTIALPGTLDVAWRLEHATDGMAIIGPVLEDLSLSLHVEDVPELQEFELVLDGDAVRALVEDPPF